MGDNTVIPTIGNGVIYKGCEILHGRSKPSSGEVIQVFCHWVISDGVKSKCAYDDGKHKEFYRAEDYWSNSRKKLDILTWIWYNGSER